jgi:beta-alanine--pyruvate transaminase
MLFKSLLKTPCTLSIQHARLTTAATNKYWMPFTDNINFKKKPKIFHKAEGIHYELEDHTKILDGMSGLWCVNAGHGQRKIVDAIKAQAEKMDFAPSFNTSHKLPAVFAEKLIDLLPNTGMKEVFFTMCGSTAVDSALKIALQYHRAKGEAGRTRFIGRERSYHGVGFGGLL